MRVRGCTTADSIRRAILAVVAALAVLTAACTMGQHAWAATTAGPGSDLPLCVNGPANSVPTPCPNPAGAAKGYVAPSLLPSAGGTAAEDQALNDLEQQAITNTINDHKLINTDGPAVQSWSRPDAEAELWALIMQAIEAPNPTPDQQGAIDWLAGKIDADGLQSAEDAGLEYAKFAGLDTTLDANGYNAALQNNTFGVFLDQTPQNFSQFAAGQGYCNYTPPAPDQGDWQTVSSQGFQPCFGPCPPSLAIGCSQPPTPTAQQFEKWGDADFARGQAALYSSPQFLLEDAQIAQALQYAGVLTGSGQGAGLSAPMQAAETDTALLQNLSGFQGLNISTAAGLSSQLSSQEFSDIIAGALGGDLVGAAASSGVAAAGIAAAGEVYLAGFGAGAAGALNTGVTAGVAALAATGPVAIAAFVLFTVAIAVIAAVDLFEGPNAQGALWEVIENDMRFPDDALAAAVGLPQGAFLAPARQMLATMLSDSTESLTLYNLFVAATLNPPLPSLDGASCTPGVAESLPGGITAAEAEKLINENAPCDTPVLQVCPSTDLTSEPSLCDTPPLPTATDENFEVLHQGVAPVSDPSGSCTNCTTEHSISFQYGSGATAGTGSVVANDDWFVDTEQPDSGGTAQTLRITYTDWFGRQQNAWLLSGSGGPVFVGYPTPGADSTGAVAPLDPSTCAQDGSCWTSPWIDIVTPNGTREMASVAPAGPATGTSSTDQLDLTASTDTATPAANTPQQFEASVQLIQAGTLESLPAGDSVSFTWQFQQLCGTIAISGAPELSSVPLLCFPAGGGTSGADVTHTWPTSGTFEVEVTAKEADSGLTATQLFSVNVTAGPPSVSATTGCPAGQGTAQGGVAVCSAGTGQVSLSATVEHSSPSDLERITIQWGDGSEEFLVAASNGTGVVERYQTPATDTLGATFATPFITVTGSHTYKQPGVHQITVTTQDQSNQTATTTATAVLQASQAITLLAPPQVQYGTPSHLIRALGGISGQPVTVQSTTPTVCSLINVKVLIAQAGLAAETDFQVTPLQVGTCTITVDQAGTSFTNQAANLNGNGTPTVITAISAAPELTQDLAVQAAPLNIRATNQTMTFGATVPDFTATITGLVNGDTSSVVQGLTCGPVDGTGNPLDAATAAPGTYTIACSGATATNYAIRFFTGTLTIGTTPLTVTADNQTMTYGGKAPKFTASAGSGQLVGGDTLATAVPNLACRPVDASGNSIDAATAGPGIYAIDCSGTSTDYGLTFVAGTLTIEKAPLTITAPSSEINYGEPLPSSAPTVVGLVNGDTLATAVPDLTCNPIGGPDFTPLTQATATPGTYPTGCSGTSSDYTITFKAGTLIIRPVSLTVTADNQTITYGQPLPVLTATVTGFVNGDTEASALLSLPTCRTTATSTSGAGTYPITCSGASSAHYTINFLAGTLTIKKATLTATPHPASLSSTYGGPAPAIGATLSGFVNGDTQSVVSGFSCGPVTASRNPVNAATAPVGVYQVLCLGSVRNYNLVTSPSKLTISPAELMVTAANQTITYGGSLPSLTVTYSGFVNGDTAKSLTAQPSCTTTATATSPAGSYPIICSGAADPDYTITNVAGELTIDKAPLTITAQNQSMTYGATQPTFNAFFGKGQLRSGDTPASAVKSLVCAPVDPNGKPLDLATAAPGTYQIDCSGTSTNYNLSFLPGTLTISQAPTTTSLTTSPNPSGSLTIDAAVLPSINPVNGAAPPSGNVDFQIDGGAVIALQSSLGGNGSADITVSNLAAGQHQLTATYSGDADYLGSSARQTLTIACSLVTAEVGRSGVSCRLVEGDLALVNLPPTITVDAPAGASGVAVDYAIPSTGDTNATVSCDPAPNSTFLIGETAVTCTATDPDDANSPLSATFDVIVEAPLRVTSSTLPTAQVGVPYSVMLKATGGTGNYTWMLVSGSLPALTVGKDGTISGTPTRSGTFSAVVSVNDPVMATITLTVDPAATGSGTGSSGSGSGTSGSGTGPSASSGSGRSSGTGGTTGSSPGGRTTGASANSGSSTSTDSSGSGESSAAPGLPDTGGRLGGSALGEANLWLSIGLLGALSVPLLGALAVVGRRRRRRG